MSNTTLTADIVAKEAVMILENDCLMANLVHRAHEDEFDKSVNGYTVGETISIRRPADFTVRVGAVMDVQDVVEGKTTLSVDTQIGVDFAFTSQDLTLQIKDLSERVIKPAMVQLTEYLDRDILSLYQDIPNHVTIPSGGIDSFADFALAGTRADLIGIPMDGRKAVLNPTDYNALVGSQTALYIEKAATQAYRKGRLGEINDFETFKSNNMPTHTHGSRTGTDLVNQAIVDGTHTWTLYKDSTYVSMGVDGMSGATVTVEKGDTFTVSDLYDVNPVSKERLPHLKMFTVMEDATASGSAISALKFWPPMILSGAHQTVSLSTGDIDNNTITWQGTASTGFRQNLFFHKNAFALAMVPLAKPPGAIDVGRRSYNGFSVRVIPVYDGVNDKSKWRLDILYGKKTIDPRLAVRASLAADI
jgi:hypothetical protein